jgi:hypothetical protein
MTSDLRFIIVKLGCTNMTNCHQLEKEVAPFFDHLKALPNNPFL